MEKRSDESGRELGYQGAGEDEGARRRLDRMEGCFMWGLGVPVVVIIAGGLVAEVWGWGTTGRVGESVKWFASVVIVVGVAAMLWGVMRVKRKK